MTTHDLQQQARPPSISAEDFQQIAPGDLVTYLLAPDMQPSDPLRQWHGRVQHHSQAGWVEVTLLDEGYVGERETVWRTEILLITKPRPGQDSTV
jgi:hypothetical protein